MHALVRPALLALVALAPPALLALDEVPGPLLAIPMVMAAVLPTSLVCVGAFLNRAHFTRSKPFWMLLGLLLLPALLACFLPPVARDEMAHHLALPLRWLQTGTFRPDPAMVVSYFPAWMHVVYAAALSLRGETLAHLAGFAAGAIVLVLPMAFRVGRGSDSLRWAPALALLWLVTPAFHAVLGVAYVDAPMLAALLAGWICWMHWAEGDGRAGYSLAAASFCVGWALAIKYAALPVAAVFAAATLWHWYSHRRVSGRSLPSVAPLLLVLLVPFVHFALNFSLTGNPVYPLGHALFGGESVQSGVAASHWQIRQEMFDESLAAQLLVPLRVFLTGLAGSQEHFDGVINPLWLVFPPLLALWRGGKFSAAEKSLAIQFLAVCLLTVLSASARARYYLPALVPLAVLLLRLAPQVDWTLKRKQIGAGLCLLGGLFGAAHVTSQFLHTGAIAYFSGKVSRETYISLHVPEYAAISRAGDALGEHSVTYPVLAGNRIYYVPGRVHLDVGFLPTDLLDDAREATGGKGLAASIRARGITHILYPPFSLDELLRAELPPRGYRAATEFFDTGCPKLVVARPFILCAVSSE